jgi:hypothetical protein
LRGTSTRRVADVVKIEEISAILGPNNGLDRLPFMPEMAKSFALEEAG